MSTGAVQDRSSPALTVTLVHGTFDRDAEWIKGASPLYNELKRHFKEGVVIDNEFKWTGRNNVIARLAAADELAKRIVKTSEEHLNAKHYIVGHSHGGNVAIYASQKLVNSQKIFGIATLARPFLHASERSEKARIPDVIGFGLSGVLVTLGYVTNVVHEAWYGESLSIWLNVIGLIILVLIGLTISVNLREFVKNRSESGKMAAQQMTAWVPKGVQLCIYRAAGFDASGALALSELVCSLKHKK
jgi:Protein of unknown function (DUF2974)